MSEQSLDVASFQQRHAASDGTPAAGRIDVLALIAEVEKRLGDVRAQVSEEHEGGNALARERDRLRSEIEILEDERSRLLARQLALESQLAEARVAEADAQSEVERQRAEYERVRAEYEHVKIESERERASAQRELERLAADARDAHTALSTELMLEFERRAAEAARRLADAESAAQMMSVEHAGRVQTMSAEMERLGACVANAESAMASLHAEHEALHAEHEALLAERADLAGQKIDFSHERSMLVADCDTLRAERDSVLGERDAIATELTARSSELAAVSAELRTQSEELARQIDEFDGVTEEQRAIQVRYDAARAECTQLQAEVEGLLRERDVMSARVAEADAAVRTAEDAANAAAAKARAATAATNAPSTPAPAALVNDEEVARVAEARIHQIMAPKVAQLAQAAAFLRTRKERLAAVRAGLRRKALALRTLRQIYAQPRLDVGIDRVPNAASGMIVETSRGTASTVVSETRIADERAELARERQELIDLRAILAASERSLEQRAQGTRLVTAAAFAVAMLGLAGVASWHIAGAVTPSRVHATVELYIASRTPEAKQDGVVDAKPVGEELSLALSDEAFIGAVASRIVERGRSHDEASALVARLAERTQVSTDGSVVRLTLAGEGDVATVSALDAVATSAVAELNRRPERRSDMLRVGIANARQEVGRTVFSRSEELADPTRIWRAGAILSVFGVLAAAAAWTMTWLARRAAHAEVQ
ncbi:MAG: hypothetical protein ACKO3W_09860 [bacterium]